MSEQNQETENKEEEKKPGGKRFPRPNPKFNFSLYWIYGFIIVALIATQFFSGRSAEVKTTQEKFIHEMLQSGDVDKVVVSNDIAHIYIKHDKLKDEKYK